MNTNSLRRHKNGIIVVLKHIILIENVIVVNIIYCSIVIILL